MKFDAGLIQTDQYFHQPVGTFAAQKPASHLRIGGMDGNIEGGKLLFFYPPQIAFR
ncbi:hypothetical protein SDC9_162488 [bioreactor metagenome]|uniref:Uncharacterized protein n=1 Tax=bioreactor metagenome TaxID=1076179 RepID=A0A645FP80_9ZZZZ